MPRSSVLPRVACVLSTAVVLSSCAPPDEEADIEVREGAVTVPSQGSATALDVGSWNLEWFGDANNGPSNEPLQLSNVRDVIAGTNMDVWGLEEVVSLSQFNSLKSQLSG